MMFKSLIFFYSLNLLIGVTAAVLPVGCYSTQPANLNVLIRGFENPQDLTVAACVKHCLQQGRAYAGLIAGSACYCGDEFGLTDAVTTCNFTCSDGSCGGPEAYSVYYVIDPSKQDRRTLFYSGKEGSFLEERRSCINGDGDIVGRRVKDTTFLASLKALVPSHGNASRKVWLGLRQRDQVYEWVDEREPNSPDTYTKEQFDYLPMWAPNDAGLKCVSLDLDTAQIASLSCSSALTSVCSFYNSSEPPPKKVKPPTPEEEATGDDKTLALFIVLPIFLICYGGACLLYCGHKILKHCCKRGAYARQVRLQRKVLSRPSSAKKNSIYPELPSMTAPMMASAPMLQMTAAEEKKLRLLEEAAREARERRDGRQGRTQNFGMRPTSGTLLPPMTSQRPPLPAAASSNGRSINEILRSKMEQQANKKRPKKIIAT